MCVCVCVCVCVCADGGRKEGKLCERMVMKNSHSRRCQVLGRGREGHCMQTQLPVTKWYQIVCTYEMWVALKQELMSAASQHNSYLEYSEALPQGYCAHDHVCACVCVLVGVTWESCNALCSVL